MNIDREKSCEMLRPLGGRGDPSKILALKMFNIDSNLQPQIARGTTNSFSSSPSITPITSRLSGIGRGLTEELLTKLQFHFKKGTPTTIPVKRVVGVEHDHRSDLNSNKIKSEQPVVRLGTSGHAVNLSTNFLRLSVKNDQSAFEYRVFYSPQIDHRAFRTIMLEEHSQELGKDLTFDGDTLFLPEKLQKDVTNLTSKHPVEDTNVTLKIKFIRKRELTDMMQVFNILFKQIMVTLNHVKIGSECYDLNNSLAIPQHKLKLLPSYVTSVNIFEDGLMLTMDPLHKVMRTQTVLREIYDISHDCQNIETAVKNNLVGKSVIAHHDDKFYTVDEVDFSKNLLSEYEMSNGERVSFSSYYKSQYGKEILDLEQPLLISRKSTPTTDNKIDETLVYLVPELCNMTGLTDEMLNDQRLMKEFRKAIKITPNQRYASLKNYVELITSNARAMQMLDNWGLRIDPLPVSLLGRELKPEKVRFGNSRTVSATKEANWSKAAMFNPVITPVNINKWVILYTQRDSKCVKEFCDCISRCGQLAGIKIAQPKLVMLQADNPESYANALRDVINQYLQLVVCICPNDYNRYAAIKKICCVDQPIPSQVIKGFTLSKPQRLRSTVHKILLQIICKLGGTLWSIPIPYSKLMVIGLDVYHSESRNVPSVCGFVASYDQKITRWYSRVCFQRPGQELMDQLRKFFLGAIKLYMETNGFLPDRIIVYRDGVGDGQLKTVKEYEVPQFESCFEEVDQDYKPFFTLLIVQKRNNTRIFTTPSTKATSRNPNPGTIIDNTITRRYLYDFYLVAHKPKEGSIVPTHYIVLHDTSNMEPDQVERMTFKMCHLYYNWPGTVGVPAPCLYAHKLAYLIGSTVKREHHISLSDKLFYL